MNFCPHCGSDQLQRTIPAGDNRLRLVCGACATIHYSNPKIVAGCLPVWQDKVLLCRRAIEPCYGLWNIPSGYLENGESVEDGAKREVHEEANAEVNLNYLVSLYSLPKINQVYLQFVGDLVDGQFGIGEESLDAQLFSEAEIPWEQMAFTSSTFALRKYLENRKRGLTVLHRGEYPMV